MKEFEVGNVYAISLDDIRIEKIEGSWANHGVWYGKQDDETKREIQKKYFDWNRFRNTYLLIKYIGDDAFEEYYTAGKYLIHKTVENIACTYDNDNIDKFLFVDEYKISDVDSDVFEGLGRQKEALIIKYITELYDTAKENAENNIKEKYEKDYMAAIGENMYYDYLNKKTR